MNYKVLSPWGAVQGGDDKGLCPRVSDLRGKTVGLLAHFKEHAPVMLREVEKLLAAKLPETRFSHFQYIRDTREVKNDPEFHEAFKAWVNSVDTIVAAYGDAGSCAMFLAYNAAYAEKLGKPVTMLVKSDLRSAAQRGAAARFVPNLRFVDCEMLDLSFAPALDRQCIENDILPFVEPIMDELIDAMTRPLADFETHRVDKAAGIADLTFTGGLREVNDYFYKMGWTNGTPILPPTEEAVSEMLTGTDLPKDYIVGVIPPMLGTATVEKIAINAVMAGCLPTYMPVLIAMVKGMLDPKIHLEGWTCSVSSWFPLMTLSGPVTTALGMNKKGAFLSPYFKASATIARAYTFIMMNLGGVRPVLEDMSELGHESRLGVVLGENDMDNPWPPLHTEYGYDRDDSAITMFWPMNRMGIRGGDAAAILKNMCNVEVDGWECGTCYVMSPKYAKKLADAGFSRKQVLDYVLEYARRPSATVPVRWITGNNHEPAGVPLPMDLSGWARKYWSTDHLFIVVGGSSYSGSCAAFMGGGDHGGPSCTKIELPKNWDALVAKYTDVTPSYIEY